MQNFYTYLKIIIFGFGLFIFHAGWKNNYSPLTLIGFGMMLLITIVIGIGLFLKKSELKKLKSDSELELINFKKKAESIMVSLENLEIFNNSWTETRIIDNSNYELDKYAESNIQKINYNLNSIKITIPLNGENIEYFINIEMDLTTLLLHFANKKETLLYKYGNEYYLDLEFLD